MRVGRELETLLDSPALRKSKLSDERYASERARWLARRVRPARIRRGSARERRREELVADACSSDDDGSGRQALARGKSTELKPLRVRGARPRTLSPGPGLLL